jgi:hypothetical protein
MASLISFNVNGFVDRFFVHEMDCLEMDSLIGFCLEMGTVHSVGSVWNWMEMDYCLERILDRFSLFGNGFLIGFCLEMDSLIGFPRSVHLDLLLLLFLDCHR